MTLLFWWELCHFEVQHMWFYNVFTSKPHDDLYLFIDRRGLGRKHQLSEQKTTAHSNGKQMAEEEPWHGP